MSKTKISWATDVWNPVTGCTRVSAGCTNCYASALHNRRYRANVNAALDYFPYRPNPSLTIPEQGRPDGAELPYPATYDTPFASVQVHPERLEEPLRWRKARRVFTCSMGDLFHEDVPDEFLDRVFAVMALSPQHTYQVLTKRPERLREYIVELTYDGAINKAGRITHALAAVMTGTSSRLVTQYEDALSRFAWPLPNVWLGTSVEDQRAAAERLPILLDTPAAVRFASVEPLLEAVDLTYALRVGTFFDLGTPDLSWVIVGGESGPKRRDCGVEAIVSVVRQCQAAGVACWVKQDSAFRAGQQGRLPDDVWAVKEMPR